MRISAKAEYACAAMLELAALHGQPKPVRIKSIADSTGISDRFLVQILLDLKKAGLVASVRGAAGGYQLARSPDKITLAEIILAIADRTITPRSELTELNRTALVEALLEVWQQVHAEELKVLHSHSLADLLKRTQVSALTYQI
ncbi:MAG: Rrf2 family transcriptional regulator [Gemmataceae bacterium]|nr:Rrf2 family transcriptional regulator [Gemmataceae bacterium]